MKLHCTFERDINPGVWASDDYCRLSRYLKHRLREQWRLNYGYFKLLSVFFHIREGSQGALRTTLAMSIANHTVTFDNICWRRPRLGFLLHPFFSLALCDRNRKKKLPLEWLIGVCYLNEEKHQQKVYIKLVAVFL